MTREYIKAKLESSLAEQRQEECINLIEDLFEKVGWNVDCLLRETLPLIENEDVRNICRRLLLAVKYDASDNYDSREYAHQPWLGFVCDNCALLQYREKDAGGSFYSSTAILSPQGDILTPKGQIWVGGTSSLYNHCFIARGVKANHEKMGLVFIDGRILLPCVFDNIVDDITIDAYYKSVQYHVYFWNENALHMKIDAMPCEREYSLGDGLSIIIRIVISKVAPDEKREALKSMTELFDILDNFYG